MIEEGIARPLQVPLEKTLVVGLLPFVPDSFFRIKYTGGILFIPDLAVATVRPRIQKEQFCHVMEKMKVSLLEVWNKPQGINQKRQYVKGKS